jgi:CheY-like chemotaxis protein
MPEALENGKTSRKRILLVDDEPFSARTLRILLTFEGYEVEFAEDGQKPQTMLNGKHDLVIVNTRITAADGRDLVRKMRAPAAKQPFIVVSNDGAATVSGPNSSKLVFVKSPDWAESRKAVAGPLDGGGAAEGA